MLAQAVVVQLGRDARRSSANVRHPDAAQVPRRSHSCLTASLACRRPVTHRGRWWDAPSARGASLASSAALPRPPDGGLTRPGSGAVTPYVNGCVNPYVIPYALGVRTPTCGGQGHLCSLVPLRGEWRGRAGGWGSIDPCGAAAFLADLRSAPPAAAISADRLPLTVALSGPTRALQGLSACRSCGRPCGPLRGRSRCRAVPPDRGPSPYEPPAGAWLRRVLPLAQEHPLRSLGQPSSPMASGGWTATHSP
jgi:hypothetical protein